MVLERNTTLCFLHRLQNKSTANLNNQHIPP